MKTIHCSKCNKDKSEDQFYKNTYKATGRCKECKKEESRAWKANNPERNKATNKKWNDNNYSKKRYRDLQRQYNITPEDYERMFIEQNESCKICNKHQSNFNKRLAVDHCHSTGKVRGLLCQNCNYLLGYSNDNIEILKKSIEYLLQV